MDVTTFPSLATYVSFIFTLVNQQSTNVLEASPGKIEHLISGGGVNKSELAGKFSLTGRVRRLFRT